MASLSSCRKDLEQSILKLVGSITRRRRIGSDDYDIQMTEQSALYVERPWVFLERLFVDSTSKDHVSNESNSSQI